MSAPDPIAERFARETAKHRMTVLHDDGLYRHLRFTQMHLCNDAEWRTTNGFYWFDLITWPGSLTINGDCGTYTFSRITDMFGFFRSRYGINPQYWAEKVQGETRVQSYSEDKFRQQVKQDAANAEEEYPGLSAAIEERFYGVLAEWDTTHEDSARRALDEFKYVPEGALCPVCSDDGERVVLIRKPAYSDTLTCPQGCGTKLEPFAFTDTWEWDLTDWDWTFLWCCHAIQWGIGQHDAKKAAAEPQAPATLLSWVRKKRTADANPGPVASATEAVPVAGGVL